MENYKNRREPIDGIIIHSMGEYIGGEFATDFLERIGLSAHFFIDASGGLIYGVDTKFVAYHAGKSEWKGQKNLNETFIGIELLVPGNHDYASFKESIKDPDTFTEDHYEECSALCRDLMNNISNRITKDRILRHSTVSGPEVRDDPKIDPGEGFDMEKLKSMI